MNVPRKQGLHDAVQGLHPGQGKKEMQEPGRNFRRAGVQSQAQQRGEHAQEEPPRKMRPRGKGIVADDRAGDAAELEQGA
jgi:hypothetical protein